MKKHIKLLIAGILLPSLLLVLAPSSFAQTPPDLGEISIYKLDNGDLSDSIADPNLKSPDATAQKNEATPLDKSQLLLAPDQNGEANKAIRFPGDPQKNPGITPYYIQTQEQASTFPVSYSVWFKADDVSGEHSIVDSDVGGQYGFSLIIGYRDKGIQRLRSLSVQYHDGFWDSGVTIEQGKWYQVYVTYGRDTTNPQKGNITLFVGAKGEPLTKMSHQYTIGNLPTPGPSAPKFRFGRHNPSDLQWFKGDISEVRFYSKELTEKEVIGEAGVPVAKPKPTVCASTGDVHIHSCDGAYYDYQGVGDFVLMRSTSNDVLIQARHESWKRKPSASVNTAIAIKMGTTKLEFYLYPSPNLQVNDAQTTLPAATKTITLTNLATIKHLTTAPNATSYLITWPDGLTTAKLFFRPTFMDLHIPTMNGGLTYEGLLGNVNSDRNDDLQIRNSTTALSKITQRVVDQVGDSWRVAAGESLFDAATAPQDITAASDQALAAKLIQQSAGDDCGESFDSPYQACTYDLAVTGDPTFIESANDLRTFLNETPSIEIDFAVNAYEVFVPLIGKQ